MRAVLPLREGMDSGARLREVMAEFGQIDRNGRVYKEGRIVRNG